MKTLHLVCNSHLDPVWQWDWNEGASAALATFYSAVNLAEKYDFIFCHNEVLLYEYIEKYDKELFGKIQELVRKGKWKIIGGWYVQPDCLVPSGESFIRQITTGREYFSEKFNARPTTALNFDSFGHTKGLPQILKKCGYDSYVFCRPMPWLHPLEKEDLPHGPFLWKGYDGSTVKALRFEDETIYCSQYGHAKENIIRKEKYYDDQDDILILWGVGNHGGVSSMKDLEDIAELQAEKKGEWKILHTTLENYFAAVSPAAVYDKQLVCFTKTYSSVSGIKQAHDELENTLYLAEKTCSVAELLTDFRYDKEVFKKAEKTLCQIEFHDVLSGTAIKTGTLSSIRKAHRAIEDLKEEMFGAFAAMAKRLPKVVPRDDNIVVFNPYPYEYNGYVEAEFFIEDSLFSDTEMYKLRVYDLKGDDVPFQIIKEESLINMDRRKRLLLRVSVPAFGVASYGINKTIGPKVKTIKDDGKEIIVTDSVKTVVIDRKTGLMTSFKVGEKEYLSGGAFALNVLNDNGDPWGWRIRKLGESPVLYDNLPEDKWVYTESEYKQMLPDLSKSGVFENLESVTVVEKGELLTEVQSLFSLGESHAVVNYKIYKDEPYADVNIHVLWNETYKALKLAVPVKGDKYFAQMAFGVEEYLANGYEYPSNRYTGVNFGEKALVVYNNSGVHSSSKEGDNLYLTLLNGSAYCAHPTDDSHSLIPDETRYVENIEQGSHDFSFRIMVNNMAECERFANEFNQKPYALSFFPHGNGDNKSDAVVLSNPNVVISAFKRLNDGKYLIRLYNGYRGDSETELQISGRKTKIKFTDFEFKTFVFDGNEIKESKSSDLY